MRGLLLGVEVSEVIAFVSGVAVGVGLVLYAQYIWRSYTIARDARRLRKQLDEKGLELFLEDGK